MQLVVIHNEYPRSVYTCLQPVYNRQPLGAVIRRYLLSGSPFAGQGKVVTFALPSGWLTEPAGIPAGCLYERTDRIPVPAACLAAGRDDSWLIITDGRFASDFDLPWLMEIVRSLNKPLVGVNIDANLAAFREKVRIYQDDMIAGFQRSYTDTAERDALPDTWPHHVFLKTSLLQQLALDGGLPSGFTDLLDLCSAKNLAAEQIRIAGKVFDLASRNGLLKFIRSFLEKTAPHGRGTYLTDFAHNGIEIADDVRLLGPVILGRNVRIRSRSVIIGPAVIGDEVEIDAGALVKSAVIAPRSRVAAREMIADKVVPSPPAETAEQTGSAGGQKAAFEPIDKHPVQNFKTWPRFSYVNFFKRIGDIIFSLIMLIIFAPVMGLLALAVKLSSKGPVFYKDLRQGRFGRDFYCLKFRSMIVGANEIQSKLRAISQVDGPQFKMGDDPRVTMVGKFLRDTSLDEIPQFINVLLGQMSVVGPRPSPRHENSLCPPWRDARLSVKPGITGLWQVCRTRSEGQDFQEWIYYDTRYIRKLSLHLDLWICWKTFLKLVKDFLSQF